MVNLSYEYFTDPIPIKPVLDKNGEQDLATLLQPLRMTFILGFFIFGCGAAKTFLALNGFLPVDRTVNVWDWVGVWIGTIIGISCVLGLIFAKSIVLRLIAHYPAKNVPPAR